MSASSVHTIVALPIDGLVEFAGNDTDWDTLTGKIPESGFMQSSFWADFKRLEGFFVRRYGFYDREAFVGGASVQYYGTPGDQGGMAVCPEGPVAPWQTDTATTRRLLRELQNAVQRDFPDALGLRIEPHLPTPRPSLLRNWQRAPLDLTPTQTLIVDLRQTDDAILAQMRPKGRYNLRLARRHGVRVIASDSMQDLSTFYSLFRETADRHEFYGEPYGFFLNLASILFSSRRGLLYLAEVQGEVLSASLVIFYGRRATYLYGGSSVQHRNVMSPYTLHWEAFQEARRRGCVEYDFYGYDPFGRPDHPYAGFSKFKRQFGGDPVMTIGAHDYLFYDRLAGRLLPHLRQVGAERNNKFL